MTKPLDALVWVFGFAAGITLLLLLLTMALAALHRHHRVNGRYTAELQAINHAPKNRERRYRSTRVLTTGDLVMDPDARDLVAKIAQQLRKPPAKPPRSSAG